MAHILLGHFHQLQQHAPTVKKSKENEECRPPDKHPIQNGRQGIRHGTSVAVKGNICHGIDCHYSYVNTQQHCKAIGNHWSVTKPFNVSLHMKSFSPPYWYSRRRDFGPRSIIGFLVAVTAFPRTANRRVLRSNLDTIAVCIGDDSVPWQQLLSSPVLPTAGLIGPCLVSDCKCVRASLIIPAYRFHLGRDSHPSALFARLASSKRRIASRDFFMLDKQRKLSV